VATNDEQTVDETVVMATASGLERLPTAGRFLREWVCSRRLWPFTSPPVSGQRSGRATEIIGSPAPDRVAGEFVKPSGVGTCSRRRLTGRKSVGAAETGLYLDP
jgi:hypothetical protein